jgi:hypothetical protein
VRSEKNRSRPNFEPWQIAADHCGQLRLWPNFEQIAAELQVELDCFKFLILDILSARRVSAELQLESPWQSEPMTFSDRR